MDDQWLRDAAWLEGQLTTLSGITLIALFVLFLIISLYITAFLRSSRRKRRR